MESWMLMLSEAALLGCARTAHTPKLPATILCCCTHLVLLYPQPQGCKSIHHRSIRWPLQQAISSSARARLIVRQHGRTAANSGGGLCR